MAEDSKGRGGAQRRRLKPQPVTGFGFLVCFNCLFVACVSFVCVYEFVVCCLWFLVVLVSVCCLWFVLFVLVYGFFVSCLLSLFLRCVCGLFFWIFGRLSGVFKTWSGNPELVAWIWI